MADRALVGLGLTLRDVGGERRIGELDQGQILADLREAGVPARMCTWLSLKPMGHYDRVLLACGERDEKYEGALLVQCRSAGETPFLAIEALSGGAMARDEAILKRMLAYLILRFDTFHERPLAILARTRHPTLSRVMRDIAAGIASAGFYPEPEGAVVPFAAASLAHRMARIVVPGRRFADLSADGPMLAAIDVRTVDEAALVDRALHLFRDRLPRAARKPLGSAVVFLPGVHACAIPRLPAPIAPRAVRVAPAPAT